VRSRRPEPSPPERNVSIMEYDSAWPMLRAGCRGRGDSFSGRNAVCLCDFLSLDSRLCEQWYGFSRDAAKRAARPAAAKTPRRAPIPSVSLNRTVPVFHVRWRSTNWLSRRTPSNCLSREDIVRPVGLRSLITVHSGSRDESTLRRMERTASSPSAGSSRRPQPDSNPVIPGRTCCPPPRLPVARRSQ
jgi:hypothetical protein